MEEQWPGGLAVVPRRVKPGTDHCPQRSDGPGQVSGGGGGVQVKQLPSSPESCSPPDALPVATVPPGPAGSPPLDFPGCRQGRCPSRACPTGDRSPPTLTGARGPSHSCTAPRWGRQL